MAERLLTLVVLIAVAGCSQSAPDDQSSIAVPVQKTVEEKRALLLAEQGYVSECMRAKGFQYRVIPPPPDGNEVPLSFGSEDVAKARREGYGLEQLAREESHTNEPQDANAVYVQSLTPERQKAFDAALFGPPGSRFGSVTLPDGEEVGFPLEGCIASARNRLYGRDATRFKTVSTFVDNLDAEVAHRVLADDELVDALDGWRACMKERGYNFADPTKAVAAAFAEPARERTIAVADAACGRANDVVSTWKRALRRHEREVYSEYEGRVIAYNELTEKALERAEQVLRR